MNKHINILETYYKSKNFDSINKKLFKIASTEKSNHLIDKIFESLKN